MVMNFGAKSIKNKISVSQNWHDRLIIELSCLFRLTLDTIAFALSNFIKLSM